MHQTTISTGFQSYKQTFSALCPCGWKWGRWTFSEDEAKAAGAEHVRAQPLEREEIMADDAVVVRVDGNAVCETCTRPYADHARCPEDDLGTFARGCDGKILKL